MIEIKKQQQDSIYPTKMCFLKRWNIIYMVKFYQNKKTLILGHIIQFFMAFITMIMLYLFTNSNFRHGMYLLPLCLVYSGIQIFIIKKGITQPKYHCLFQLASCIIFISIFLGAYFYIYHPTFKQRFDKGIDCKIVKDSKVILQDGSYQENFQVLTVQFAINDKVYYGCGCGSDKYQETIFQTKIEPFRYVTNDEMTSLNIQTKIEEDDISQIKMPSWMCQPYQNYTSNLKDSNNQSNKLQISKCYYNYYGEQKIALTTQSEQDYCKKSDDFIQVIFEEKPFFPVDQFCLLIAFTLIPFFSFSFNWILVIIIHYLAPCLLVEVEKGFFNQQQRDDNSVASNKKVHQNKVTPTCKINPLDQQNEKPKESQQQNSNAINPEMKRSSQLSQFINSNICHENNKNENLNNNLEQESIAKEFQNISISIDNKLLSTYQETLKSSSDISFLNQKSFSSDNQRTVIASEQLEPEQVKKTRIQQKSNEILFSIPITKKKVLPPIQVSVNYQNVHQERIKQEIEEKKKTIDQPIQSNSPQQLRIQNTYSFNQISEGEKSPNHIIHSILQNKQRKGLKSALKRSKVQFQEKDEESNNNQQKKLENE